MKKFLTFLDDNILKFLIAFAIVFIPLYPKLPSISIPHVWVYVRLEDFLIFVVVATWLIQLLRRKVSLPRPEGYSLVGYWAVGVITLIYCLLFVASHLANFFPQIAALEFFRRIEYMILFFAAYSSVKKQKDIVVYVITLCITVGIVTIYGFGQKFYLLLWGLAPAFFKLHPFCFPAYLTGNEEFAKGTPFCLDSLSRISSTFGGHYDLAAFLVVVIPIFIALIIVTKRWSLRVLLILLVLGSLELLNFTSSRTSFAAYLLGVISMLVLWNKKKWILPVTVVSIGVLFVLSSSTLQRFEKTIQPVQVIQVSTTNPDLLKKISKTQQTEANKAPQSPAPGTLINDSNGTDLTGESSQVLTQAVLKSLQDQDINISTVSGAFLLKKAYALDISFTTRFQAEWPRDWQAFISSPIFGTGYSSLTLASDNDYLRALGETGLVGALSFFFIFLIFGIFMRRAIGSVKDPLTVALLFGLTGGVIGLLLNAALIDVFEASKVAEPLWILLGIGLGGAKLYQKTPIHYKKELLAIFTSHTMIVIYFFLLVLTAFVSSVNNFFVADDFTWLHWAATSAIADLPKYFIQSPGFFYRPLDKTVIFFLYQIFSFQPEGYHLFILFVHFVTAVGVYLITKKLLRNKLLAILMTMLFILHPAHSENIFWFSTLSDDLSSLFIIYSLHFFISYREKKSIYAYLTTLLFSVLALASYEIAVVTPLLFLALDIFVLKPKKNSRFYLSYIPFVLLIPLYFVMRWVSQSFSGGGDYSYHLSHIIPNTLGNIFGYTGIFVSGLPFLTFYNFLRTGLRTEWIYFSIVALLLVVYIVWLLFVYRKKIKVVFSFEEMQLFLFGLVFALVALLPFLPLGNIAPRYLYLASVGYTLSLVVGIRFILTKILKTKRQVLAGLVIISLLLGSIYFVSNLSEQKHWQKSGEITKNTLLYFRKTFADFAPKTDLYFVNTPVQQNNTWVFPVGLSDGIWFIYREKTPQIHQTDSLQAATALLYSNGNNDSYIFAFDKNAKIKRVK